MEVSKYSNNKLFRKEMRKQFQHFCLIYFSHYFKLPPAKFFPELLANLSDHTIKLLLMIGFRGSAKSTFGSMALPIWAALEHPELYPFIVPISDTSTQSALNIANIKTELDNNALLREDYGKVGFATLKDPNPEPTFEGDDEWKAQNMVLSNGVRIMARARGQKVRGMRHKEHRIKLCVVDDPEDVQWVKTKENRDTTDRWMRGEVMPAIDELDGRLITIGNWLHEDALMARMKKTGLFKVLEYPLIKDGEVMWPAKYPNKKSLDDKQIQMGPVAWQREMLLKVVAEEGQEITPEDIQYYDRIPIGGKRGVVGHGVDLAISTKSSADCTTDVEGQVHYHEGHPRIYVMPHPLNRRMDFNQTMTYFEALPGSRRDMFFVEDVAYQKAAIQEMERRMMPVTPMRPLQDKRARLRVAARFVKNGTVLFPRTGCEELIGQLIGFGSESHDDLCLIGETLVLTENGNVPIKHITAGNMVMTRQGYRKVLWAGKTGEKKVITNAGITGTPDHPVITSSGKVALQDLVSSDMIYIWNSKEQKIIIGEAGKKAQHAQSVIYNSNTTRVPKIGRQENIAQKYVQEKCLLKILGRECWGRNGVKSNENILSRAIRGRSIGIGQVVKSVIPRFIGGLKGIVESRRHAKCAQKQGMGTKSMTGQTSAETTNDVWMTISGYASHVIGRLIGMKQRWQFGERISRKHKLTLKNGTHLSMVMSGTKNRQDFYQLSSMAVPVYNLTIEGEHEFFANGILVHNCDGATNLILGLAETGVDIRRVVGMG